MKRLIFISLFLLTLIGVEAQVLKKIKAFEEKFQAHVGFVLYDPNKKKPIVEYKSHNYFTPASNTKIFTFYAGLKLLGDSVPALKYSVRRDSLIFWGTGDPSLLNNKVYTNDRVLNFLRSRKERLYYSASNFYTTHLGPGWGWDDYKDSYSAERSPMPLYGNLFAILGKNKVSPSFFSRYVKFENEISGKALRKVDSNDTAYSPKGDDNDTVEIPIHIDADLTANMLTDTLDRSVRVISTPLPKETLLLRSVPADSLYKVMMQESDNFLAEHILLMCAGMVSDSLKPETAIRYAKKNFLNDLQDEPQWVDGSGLSRYNLLTPSSIVSVWEKIYNLKPKEELFPLLAIGGVSGTIKTWYKSDKPYIFGKTGTLSNNHSLSGFIVTKKGTTLIFALMSNNFTKPVRELRKDMEDVLRYIYNKY